MTQRRTNTGEQPLKKQNNTIGLRIIILLIVLLSVFFGIFLWWQNAMTAYDPADKKPVIFTVSPGENVRDIASQLAHENLVRSPTGFYILVKILGLERQMQAGEYQLTRDMDAKIIAEKLTHGMRDTWVTILEGWRIEEIATKIAKEFEIPEKEFLLVAEEGYMFPDTYRFPKDASASAIVAIIKKNFEEKVVVTYAADIKKSSLSLYEIITLASIIEREGNSDEDRPTIAGVLFNRLEKEWPLETDATLQYALGYQTAEKTWWKKSLSEEDKSVDSPYNTYRNIGLPVGPISNPGIASIKAVLSPKSTEYMFYIHDKNGGVHFAKTLSEHEANIDKYLR